jgi:DNA replication protein DnaC
MCTCSKKLLVTENIKRSGMGELIDKQSFDTFKLDAYSYDADVQRRMQANVSMARAFAEGFGKRENKGKNLLLIGTTGSGKTHISTAIAKEIIERGFNVIYESIHNIITDFENDKFRSGYNSSEPVSDKYLECDLLIIDDLGTEFSTPFSTSCIYNILNTRQNRGLSTIISTNYAAQDLAKRYDDRIYSRITASSYTVLFFNGRDYRSY